MFGIICQPGCEPGPHPLPFPHSRGGSLGGSSCLMYKPIPYIPLAPESAGNEGGKMGVAASVFSFFCMTSNGGTVLR